MFENILEDKYTPALKWLKKFNQGNEPNSTKIQW